MHRRSCAFLLGLLVAASPCTFAQEPEPQADPAAEETPAAAPRIAVLVPEQVDGEWYWYEYAGGQQHLVQTAVEKALVSAGFDVVDVARISGWPSLEDLITPTTAAREGSKLGVDYVVAGRATAVKASQGSAYGVNVYRSSAEITLRLVRVEDGKVMAVEDANALAGGQAARSAGQEALKEAGKQAARKMVAALRKETGQNQ